MDELVFTDDESEAIGKYAAMPVNVTAAINSVAAELVPAVAAFAWGLYRDKTLFLVLGMFLLIYMTGYRAFKQFRYAKLLKSICTKIRDVQGHSANAESGAG